MEMRRRVLGEEHPSTLISMSKIAFRMKEQGRTIEAIKLMEECVQLCKGVLGTEHPQTVTSAVALAELENID
jgi:hypothetical protein